MEDCRHFFFTNVQYVIHHELTGAFLNVFQKEEHILAQEAVLDALLSSEDGRHQWPPWSSEDQICAVRFY